MNNLNLDVYNELGNQIAQNRDASFDHFVVDLDWKEGFRSEISVRDFAPFIVDEPEVIGATNKGPNPVEYMLAGAVSCFTVGVVASASTKGIAIKSLKATIEGNVDMSIFYGTVLGGEHGITQAFITLRIDADAPLEELEACATHSLTYSPVLNSLKLPVKVIPVKG